MTARIGPVWTILGHSFVRVLPCFLSARRPGLRVEVDRLPSDGTPAQDDGQEKGCHGSKCKPVRSLRSCP